MNDDEWPDTFEPFLKQFKKYKKSKIPAHGSLAFLRDWESPVSEDNMEEFTEPGARDAEDFGRRLSERYKQLMPEDHNEPFKYVSAGCISVSPSEIDLVLPAGSSQLALIETSILPMPSFMACSPVARLAMEQG